MNTTAQCIERLRAVVDDLKAEGVPPVFVVAALTELAVNTAKLDPACTDAQLETIISITIHHMPNRPVAEQFLDTYVDRSRFS